MLDGMLFIQMLNEHGFYLDMGGEEIPCGTGVGEYKRRLE